jgi:hypothetical protein
MPERGKMSDTSNEQDKQESMQKLRDQQNKDRGRKVIPYTGFLTPKNAYALKPIHKKTKRKKVAPGKSSQ